MIRAKAALIVGYFGNTLLTKLGMDLERNCLGTVFIEKAAIA
jgi:hypothetical protein